MDGKDLATLYRCIDEAAAIEPSVDNRFAAIKPCFLRKKGDISRREVEETIRGKKDFHTIIMRSSLFVRTL